MIIWTNEFNISNPLNLWDLKLIKNSNNSGKELANGSPTIIYEKWKYMLTPTYDRWIETKIGLHSVGEGEDPLSTYDDCNHVCPKCPTWVQPLKQCGLTSKWPGVDFVRPRWMVWVGDHGPQPTCSTPKARLELIWRDRGGKRPIFETLSWSLASTKKC